MNMASRTKARLMKCRFLNMRKRRRPTDGTLHPLKQVAQIEVKGERDPCGAQAMNMPPVMVVDDDPQSLDLMRILLSEERFLLYTARNASDAIQSVRQFRPRLILLNLELPSGDGLDLMAEFLRLDASIAVILVTSNKSTETAVEAIQAGAYDYFTKPLNPARLKVRVDAWMESQPTKLAESTPELGSDVRFQGLIGDSQVMRGLFCKVRRAAPHFSVALVTGDSGTGKELVARALHSLSARSGAFVVCNCSAIPDTLFESQLFGYSKGAFTGATRDEGGSVAAAEGGTLFLDEIGELPLSLQPKLLRFLQNGEIQRLGSPTAIQANVRVVAATNRDLVQSVKQHTFREDLYYRLAMVQFRIPPLSERMHDFHKLLYHFLDVSGTQYAKPGLTLSPRAQRVLQKHSWPGNIRELQNVVGYACMMAEGTVVEIGDFPDWWIDTLTSQGPPAGAVDLHDLEQNHILQVLEACKGNRTKAAKALGIARATLYRVLAKIVVASELRPSKQSAA